MDIYKFICRQPNSKLFVVQTEIGPLDVHSLYQLNLKKNSTKNKLSTSIEEELIKYASLIESEKTIKTNLLDFLTETKQEEKLSYNHLCFMLLKDIYLTRTKEEQERASQKDLKEAEQFRLQLLLNKKKQKLADLTEEEINKLTPEELLQLK